jgi:pimeloyl-ACP methyl ester carboxylesterase
VTYREQLIDLPDGRTLEVATLGTPTGSTVFFHHGTPGTTRTLKMFEPLLELGDFYLVTASRPAYGQSSRDEGHQIASAVDDAKAALARVGRKRYVALGWSGGGPRSLASAALDNDCLGAVALASIAPADVDFDWTDGMGPENVTEFALAKEGGAPYEEYMAAVGEEIAKLTGDNLYDLFGGLLPDADRAALSDDEYRQTFVDSMTYGFANGWRGYFDDNVAAISPWGFDVSNIDKRVHLFYGDADLMVPPTHGAWLTRNIPRVVTHRRANEGHVSIYSEHFDELAEVLTDLSA